uniref:CTTNBP2 N-terminal-like protein n=1 Tax=Hirondellea gigas TaxID=1518452 RepID=A0A6A7G3X3_9CRUS
MASVGPPKDVGVGGGAQISSPSPQQGQSFQPMDKASSQTVKLNPKLELSHTELLKLLSYMEAELQARDVVIATLKTERIKSLLAYGRGGVHDPVLALQRDTGCVIGTAAAAVGDGSAGGAAAGAAGDSQQQQMKCLQDTQLTQLEHLITQQRKAHQRMRHVLREAEKRHSRVVGELEDERRKHEHDTAQGDDVTYALERDRARLKQSIDSERSLRRTAEAECSRISAEREDQRSRHKQMVLLLLEDRTRLAAQAAHHKHRAEQLAKVVSEEKGRMDGMAEGLEEESKKSLQMEAEMEKQLAQFDTERQQMRALLQRRDDRVEELECHVEKLQRDVSHYQKQLQEAHNVAMFQQTLSVSSSRLPSSAHGPPSPNILAPPGGSPNVIPPPSGSPNILLPSVAASVVTGISISQAQNVVSIPSLSQGSAGVSGGSSSNISGGSSSQAQQQTRLPLSSTALGGIGKTATLPSGVGGSSSNKPQPPQLPAKPPQLSHAQTRLPGTLPPPKVAARVRASSPGVDEHSSSHSSHHHSSIITPPTSSHSVGGASSSSSHQTTGAAHSSSISSTSSAPSPSALCYSPYTAEVAAGATGVNKSVQLTATVNSVPVTLPTTGIARGVQPVRSVLYQPHIPSCGGEGCEVLGLSVGGGSSPSAAGSSPQVVQLSPRVNVSASGSGKVITSSQGGKFTFQVSTTTSPASQHGSSFNQNPQHQQVAPPTSRKPLPPARSATTPSASSSSARGVGLCSSSTPSSSAINSSTARGASLNSSPAPSSSATNSSTARSANLSSSSVSSSTSQNLGTAISNTSSNSTTTRINKDVSTGGSTTGSSNTGSPPPLPPNKPLLIAATAAASLVSKKDSPICLELKPHKLGPQTLKFGITISKTSAVNSSSAAALGGSTTSSSASARGEIESSSTSALINSRRDVIAQVTQTS